MINLDSKIWGPHGWFFIESIVIALPENISPSLQKELKHFFISLSSLLPCEKCRYHFLKYIKKTNIMDIDFSKKDKVLKWINTVHNEIRKRNGSNTISIEKTIKYYDDKYNTKIKTSFKDILYIIIFIIIILLLLRKNI
jgi:hypothetical protein